MRAGIANAAAIITQSYLERADDLDRVIGPPGRSMIDHSSDAGGRPQISSDP